MNINEIKAAVDRLAVRIGTSQDDLPTYGKSADGARPHIETNGFEYHYVIVERGTELERRTTRDLNQLLFWIFDDVAFEIASNYELAHRDPKNDPRRLLFRKYLEVMTGLSLDWGHKCQQKLDSILKDSPFIDK